MLRQRRLHRPHRLRLNRQVLKPHQVLIATCVVRRCMPAASVRHAIDLQRPRQLPHSLKQFDCLDTTGHRSCCGHASIRYSRWPFQSSRCGSLPLWYRTMAPRHGLPRLLAKKRSNPKWFMTEGTRIFHVTKNRLFLRLTIDHASQ